VAHLGQGPHLDQDAVAQDADTVAQRFDLAQDVRREKDGLATLVGLVDADTEGLLHEGIEPAVGSSRTSRSGLVMRAAMSWSFWRLPFE